MRTRERPELRGREGELRAVAALLDTAAGGRGGVLLVEGEPGIGRSALLSWARSTAAGRGFAVVPCAVRELGHLTVGSAPYAPVPEDRDDDPAARGVRAVARAERCLRERTARGPALVAVDDLQRAGHAVLAGLAELCERLADLPVAWLLARATAPPGEAARAFRSLARAGAERVRLAPLGPGATAQVVADVLGLPPGDDLAAPAAEAGGNPRLLLDLLEGLREEGALDLSGPRARLSPALPPPKVPPQARDGRPYRPDGPPYETGHGPGGERPPPERVLAAVRDRLDALGGPARHLVEAAAALGGPFTPERVADLMGTTPAALLPALEEALAAGLLTPGEETLAFRHELVRRAVLADLPLPVRRAVRRQAGAAEPRAPARWECGRPASGWDSLTGTERAVALLVAQGRRNRQVAEELFVSVHTVAFHLRQIFRKLGISSRVDLARIAAERQREGASER
ncbi:DNA-binding CsgD family transcriptional regulator [Thermocatellispora tengchongensis]|uniref:DNA-binding CsgD family transcriptional regulator n=1 Tax=Thermocatellispora tengchongensis TaxID=1073253 RepID=A0A840P3V0_9ACTN|nr:LuxR family transcriptional regulator [Thermocatellispora tengchongensis]MBB5131917.1 DNA-binding CsgD family transcriptional regulator [Thermocatellispora tengchongensis]